jgi:hypothetical protein
MKQSLGMRTTSAWHREQILEACWKLDLRNHNRLSKGMIPIQSSLTTMTTSQSVPSAPANRPTATASLTPRLHHHHPTYPPSAWDKLSSIVSKLKRWLLDLPPPSLHTVKIPLRFRGKENHPPITPQGPEVLNQNLLPKESKFWTYLLEDIKTEDIGDPAQYVMLDQMLTCGQLQQMKDQGTTPFPHRCRGTNSIEVSTMSRICRDPPRNARNRTRFGT